MRVPSDDCGRMSVEFVLLIKVPSATLSRRGLRCVRLESKAPLLDVWKRSQYSRNRNLKVKLQLIKKGTKEVRKRWQSWASIRGGHQRISVYAVCSGGAGRRGEDNSISYRSISTFVIGARPRAVKGRKKQS